MPSLRRVIGLLEKQYGQPKPPEIQDPFALILYENIAYLVSDDRRERAFLELKKRVGVGLRWEECFRDFARGVSKKVPGWFATSLVAIYDPPWRSTRWPPGAGAPGVCEGTQELRHDVSCCADCPTERGWRLRGFDPGASTS